MGGDGGALRCRCTWARVEIRREAEGGGHQGTNNLQDSIPSFFVPGTVATIYFLIFACFKASGVTPEQNMHERCSSYSHVLFQGSGTKSFGVIRPQNDF